MIYLTLLEETIDKMINLTLLAETTIGWLFNSTSTQKGQFVPTAGQENRVIQLRMVKACNAYYIMLHNNNVTQITVKHSSYISATTGYLTE